MKWEKTFTEEGLGLWAAYYLFYFHMLSGNVQSIYIEGMWVCSLSSIERSITEISAYQKCFFCS
jgi:hypothetical protein